MRDTITQLTYLAASVLFIFGLRSLTRPDKARRGMQQAAVGMLLALCGTLMNHQIVDYRWIAGGLVLGALIGYPLGMWVPTTALPQRIAMSLSFGALAATLVGVAEYYSTFHGGDGQIGMAKMAALGFEVLLGSLTVTGALIAAGKLQEWIPSQPMTYRGQNLVNFALFAAACVLFGMVVVNPAQATAFYGMIGLAALLGVLMVMPIGGADMPVVVALLNSYCGLAAAATGFALGNSILIICGALDGASGFLLSILMSKAMNRSFANVLFGAFGGESAAAAVGSGSALPVRSVSAEDAAIQLAYASSVIIVPGYGLAVAQAQHACRELGELLESRGVDVKYAIHPVAGRMPGHMNVLLAEANVPYPQLKEMEEINPEFDCCDVALVVGANDVTNPAARKPGSPVSGMPILDVDHAKSIIVIKRSMGRGYAGIDNELYTDPKTGMLFADAKDGLAALTAAVKAL